MKLDLENTYNAKYLAMLPQWKCHKVVQAGKISLMAKDEPNGMLMIHAAPSHMPFAVPLDFLQRHSPEIGGYLVVYEDGYLSYSPANVFEAGYHELPPLGLSCGSVGGEAAVQPAETLVTDMPPHQLRVLQELAEVSTCHQKLSEFLKTKLFLSLDAAERDRLTRQHGVMGEYVRILIDRVAASQGES